MIPAQRIRELSFPLADGKKPLVHKFNGANLGSYHYNLTIDAVVVLGRKARVIKGDELRHGYSIAPGKIVWLRMAECIATPSNIVASLEQTHYFTRRGLSFLNLSLIFPNYHGFVTCAVANFSGVEISVNPTEHVARLLFFELDKSEYPHKSNDSSDLIEYEKELVKEARGCDDNFLGEETFKASIRAEVKKDIEGMVRSATWRIGFVSALIVLLFTVLPVLQESFTSAWYGGIIVSDQELHRLERILDRLDAEQGNLKKEQE